MHLGVGETSIVLYTLQSMTGITTQHYIVFLRLLAVLLAVRSTNNNMIIIPVDASIKALLHGPVILLDATASHVLNCGLGPF